MKCFTLRQFPGFHLSFCLFSILSLLPLGSTASSSAVSSATHILVDPGHGGQDSGAYYRGTKESNLVLQVAKKLEALLKNNSKFKVTMTRTNDRFLTLPQRVKLAEQVPADLFISLHANSASDSRARGIEFYFQNQLPPDEDALFLASQENNLSVNRREIAELSGGTAASTKGDITAIVEDLKRQGRTQESLKLSKSLNSSWLGEKTDEKTGDNTGEKSSAKTKSSIKQAPFYVISKTTMPAVLIEIGFLTNPRESEILNTTSYQNELAQKIYLALIDYKEKVDNKAVKTVD